MCGRSATRQPRVWTIGFTGFGRRLDEGFLQPARGMLAAHHPVFRGATGAVAGQEVGGVLRIPVDRSATNRALRVSICLLAAWLSAPGAGAQSHTNLQTVFLLVMENVNWPMLKT